MATMAQLKVADLSLNLKGPHQPAEHSKADPAWTHLGSWLKAIHLRGKSPASDEAGRGPRRHDPTAWEPERDGFNPPESDSTW
jgi:hypothetical protein